MPCNSKRKLRRPCKEDGLHVIISLRQSAPRYCPRGPTMGHLGRKGRRELARGIRTVWCDLRGRVFTARR